MLRNSLFLLLLISTFAVHAAPIALQTKAPASYVVQSGDTQWDLANKYLKNPSEWSTFWNAPPIYVGDTLILATDQTGAHLTVNHGHNLNNNGVLIPPLPLKPMTAFLNKNAAMTQDEFGQLPYVLALTQGQSVADKNDTITARGLVTPKLDQTFLVLHKKRVYLDPDNAYKILGVEADYIATAKVTKVADSINLQLTQVDQLVQIGDRLVLPQTAPASLQFNLQAAGKLGKPVRAQIIASLIDYVAIGKYSLVALNYGAQDGAVPGQVLFVTSELSSKKPIGKQIGTIVIFRTFPQVSWAMVMQMNAQMQLFNGVQSPNN